MNDGKPRSVEIQLRREDITSPAATSLILTLNGELSARYPEPGANHFRLDSEEVAPGRGAFFIAFRGEEPIGCGAVRRIDETTAEVKRMFVAPEARGQGIGRQILEALEAEARRLGARRLVLETGARQQEALALYTRAGFTQIPEFGEYIDSPLSICMAKEI